MQAWMRERMQDIVVIDGVVGSVKLMEWYQ